MNIDLNNIINEKEMKEKFEGIIKEEYRRVAINRINVYFRNKSHNHGDGVGTLMVHEIIDGLLTDENIKQKVNGFIEKHFDEILEKACIDAIAHRARSAAFQHEKTKSINPKE